MCFLYKVTCAVLLQKNIWELSEINISKTRKTTISSTLLLILRFQGYRCELGHLKLRLQSLKWINTAGSHGQHLKHQKWQRLDCLIPLDQIFSIFLNLKGMGHSKLWFIQVSGRRLRSQSKLYSTHTDKTGQYVKLIIQF